MTLLTILGVFNYGLVLLYGLFLSVFIAGGWENRKQRGLVIALCPVFILIQVPGWLLLGEDTIKKLYPLIVHLPLVLILISALKKPVGVSVVSVLTAYLCCQLPRWGNIAVAAVTHWELAGEIAYILIIGPLFFLLLRYFVKPAHAAFAAAFTLTQVRTSNMGSLFKLTYEVTLRDPAQEKAMLDELRCRNGNLELALSYQDTAAMSL